MRYSGGAEIPLRCVASVWDAEVVGSGICGIDTVIAKPRTVEYVIVAVVGFDSELRKSTGYRGASPRRSWLPRAFVRLSPQWPPETTLLQVHTTQYAYDSVTRQHASVLSPVSVADTTTRPFSASIHPQQLQRVLPTSDTTYAEQSPRMPPISPTVSFESMRSLS